jgi:hypothetical protein
MTSFISAAASVVLKARAKSEAASAGLVAANAASAGEIASRLEALPAA